MCKAGLLAKSIPFPQLLWRKFPVPSEAGNEGLLELIQRTMWFLTSIHCARTMKWSIFGRLKHQSPVLNLIRTWWNSAVWGIEHGDEEKSPNGSQDRGCPDSIRNWHYNPGCITSLARASISPLPIQWRQKVFLTRYRGINETPGTQKSTCWIIVRTQS